MPGNSTITVPGKVSKLVAKGSYMVELAVHNNLPSGAVVNHSYVTPKEGQVAVIIINTTSRNIWICQPLLAAKIFEVALHPWQYQSMLYKEGNTIKVRFQPVVPLEVEGGLPTNQVEVKVKEEPSEEESTPPLPSFGPHPNTTKDYNFEDEVAKLPFRFNLGDAPFSKEQEDHLLNLIYDHKEHFHSMMKTWSSVINWPSQSQLQQTSLCICLTGPFHDNFKVRLENSLIHGSDKASSDH